MIRSSRGKQAAMMMDTLISPENRTPSTQAWRPATQSIMSTNEVMNT